MSDENNKEKELEELHFRLEALAGEYVLLKKYRSYEPSLMLRLAEKHGHEYLERFRPFERLGKMRFPSLLPLGALAELKAISVFEDGAAEDIIEQHPNVPLGVITVVEGLTGSGRGVTRLLDILEDGRKYYGDRLGALRGLTKMSYDSRVVPALVRRLEEQSQTLTGTIPGKLTGPMAAPMCFYAIWALLEIGESPSTIIPLLDTVSAVKDWPYEAMWVGDGSGDWPKKDRWLPDVTPLTKGAVQKRLLASFNAMRESGDLIADPVAQILAAGPETYAETTPPEWQIELMQDAPDPKVFSLLIKALEIMSSQVEIGFGSSLGGLSMNAAAQILQRQSSDQQREHNTRALIESLTSQSEVLRWFAAEQLGVIQAPEAVNELKRLLDDDERKIRKAAKKAIKAIESAARA